MRKKLAKLLRHWAYLLDKPAHKPRKKPDEPLLHGWPEEP